MRYEANVVNGVWETGVRGVRELPALLLQPVCGSERSHAPAGADGGATQGSPRDPLTVGAKYQLGLRVETFDSHTFLKAHELQMLSCYLPLAGLLAAPNPLHWLPDSDTHPLGGKRLPSGGARSKQALAVHGAHPGEQVWDANLALVLGTRRLLCSGLRAGSSSLIYR